MLVGGPCGGSWSGRARSQKESRDSASCRGLGAAGGPGHCLTEYGTVDSWPDRPLWQVWRPRRRLHVGGGKPAGSRDLPRDAAWNFCVWHTFQELLHSGSQKPFFPIGGSCVWNLLLQDGSQCLREAQMPLSPREGQSLAEGSWLCSSATGSVQLSHLHLSGSCLEGI